jgi:hypothetical protein
MCLLYCSFAGSASTHGWLCKCLKTRGEKALWVNWLEMAENLPDDTKRRKLVGYENFVRGNPKSDKFDIHRFHHIEFYTSDATSSSKR